MGKIPLFVFTREGVGANLFSFNILSTTPRIFELKRNYKGNFWKSQSRLTKDEMNFVFPKFIEKVDNIICLELIPGKKRNVKILEKNFPLYAHNIYEGVPSCDGIWFKTAWGDPWLSPRRFEIIKEKYSKFSILGINFSMIKSMRNFSSLAEKIVSYQGAIDAVYFDINDRELGLLEKNSDGRNFYEEIDRELQVIYKTRK
jgi:hypothetical protein